MLHTKFLYHCTLGSGEEGFFKVFTIYCMGERTGLVVRASDSRSVDPGSIFGRVGVLFP